MSNVDRSKCSGGWHEMRSDGEGRKQRAAHSRNDMILEWVITTPLGTPVDPDVNRIWAASWAVLPHGSGVAGVRSTSSQQKAAPRPSGGVSGPNQPIPADLACSGNSPSKRPAEALDARTYFGSQASTILARRAAGLPVSSGT